MIIDLQRFISTERPAWKELELVLNRLEAEPNAKMSLEEVQRFHELYERATASLAKLTTFSSEPATRQYLESLVARAYGEVHETRQKRRRLQPLRWLRETLPQTFRRQIRAFQLAVAITLAGCAFGTAATLVDPDSRHVTMPFGHDRLKPSQRVAEEEKLTKDRLTGNRTNFSSQLMTNNTRVSILTLSLGATWGIGTILILFYNGISMGAIVTDYVSDGQARFLLGWLLPHGAIEIPAILVAGQAGFVLARGLIGWGDRTPLTGRLRTISPDLVTLSIGFALMLVWAGFVEAFLSQYHEPVVPYGAKIAFGLLELGALILYLGRSGRT
jgi:uncharacterized membrane protein SpoIIM required for sporulation